MPARKSMLRRIWPDQPPRTFISFEGIDGCGKSTVRELLQKRLKERGVPFAVTTQASDKTVPGRTARRYLRQRKLQVTQLVTAPLFSADTRLNELKTLGRGERLILGDKSAISNFVYTRVLDKTPQRYLRVVWAGVKKPDVAVLFDIDPEVAMQRISNRSRQTGQQVEQHEKIEKLRKLRGEYLKFARNPDPAFRNTKWVVIKVGNRKPEEILTELVDRLAEHGITLKG